VGAALRTLARPREQLIVATKCRGRTGPGPNQVGLSRAHILSAIDASLARLKLDYVDLYQIHGFDSETPIEETVRALDDVVRAGKVRYVGFCNLSAWQAMKALGLAERWNMSRFVSAQVYYSIAGRDIERELVPLAQSEGLAILPWSPLAGGLLSGKFDPDKPWACRCAPDQLAIFRQWTDRACPKCSAHCAKYRRLRAARSRASHWRGSSAAVRHEHHHRREEREQLTDNLGGGGSRLSAEHVAQLDAASDLPVEYPGWMLSWQNRERRPATR